MQKMQIVNPQQLWKSLETKELRIILMASNENNYLVTFEIDKIVPKRTYVFTKDYMHKNYAFEKDAVIHGL